MHRVGTNVKAPTVQLAWALVLVLGAARAPEAIAGEASDMLARWAPVHHQDVDTTGNHALNGRADYLAAVDFDDDWDCSNNWENAADRELNAVVYTSAAETANHWFLFYGFYHPRDWTDRWFSPRWIDSEHENDFEALLLIVRKQGDTDGVVEGAITVFHQRFLVFLPAGTRLRPIADRTAGPLNFVQYEGLSRPVTAQEAKGHGLAAWPFVELRSSGGVIYVPGSADGEEPADPDDAGVPYALVDIFAPNGLWSQRVNPRTFSHWGRFSSDTNDCGGPLRACLTGKASAPWDLYDGRDSQAERGWIATHPAGLCNLYFPGQGFDTEYIGNPYQNP